MRKVYVVGGHWEVENMFKSVGLEAIGPEPITRVFLILLSNIYLTSTNLVKN
jgi:hypothetical protein